MLSKLFTRLNQTQSMTQWPLRAFRATPQMNKKPSIGDAVTILQSKVSNINQVVSITSHSVANHLRILSSSNILMLRAAAAYLQES
jgi:hypothetical protein